MQKVSQVPSIPAADVPETASSSVQVHIEIPTLATPDTRSHRWLTFEEETSIDQIAVIGALSLLLVGGFWFAFNKLLGKSLRIPSWSSTIPASTEVAIAPVPSIPPKMLSPVLATGQPVETMHSSPALLHDAPAMTAGPAEAVSESLPAPGKLSVQRIAPRMLDIQWDSLGEGYTYRLYWAATSGLYDPQPALEQALPVTYLVWSPGEELHDFWIAVKGFDPQGRETGFSPPVHIHAPR